MYEASAPGSLMLLGEYAVLNAKPALVAAIDKRLTVTINPDNTNIIKISTPTYKTWEGKIGKLTLSQPFTFVTACLAALQAKLPSGCTINITSTCPDTMGLGSSAAVTVATLAAIHAWLHIDLTPTALLRLARTIVRQVQGGRGSGADLAASIYGGIVYYKPQPLIVKPAQHAAALPLAVIYSGTKLPTPEAIQRVTNYFAEHPKIFQHLCTAIAACVEDGYNALNAGNYPMLAKIFNIQQGLMAALGVTTTPLTELLDNLRQCKQVLGAKVSGAGFGDCVIALGTVPTNIVSLPVTITTQGVACHGT